MFLSDFLQFVVFMSQFFKSYGIEQWRDDAYTCNKKHKNKLLKGKYELNAVFSTALLATRLCLRQSLKKRANDSK